MAIYIKTKMTAVPRTCHMCQYYEHNQIVRNGRIIHEHKCNAVKPFLSANNIDVLKERHQKCPLREHGGTEDFEGLHFVNPYTTRLIKSMKELEKYAERFHRAQKAAEAEEGDMRNADLHGFPGTEA